MRLGRISVLGGDGFGFWSQSSLGLFEEEEEDEFMKIQFKKSPDIAEMWRHGKGRRAHLKFIDGQDLPKEMHLDDTEGWKLAPDVAVRRPIRRRSLIGNWDEWHAWRGLAKSSTASLLMHYPLTVYWMLAKTLNLVSIKPEDTKNRVHLTAHYIGAEVELNFIPMYAYLIHWI